MTVEKSNLLYHEWVLRHGGGTAPKPDLVVAFNSGAHTGRRRAGERKGREGRRNGKEVVRTVDVIYSFFQ